MTDPTRAEMRPGTTGPGATCSLETLHVDADDLPYVEMEGGIEFRLLQVRLEERLVVTQVRAQPGASSQLHRHLEPVYGFTTRGRWGHDRTFSYRPGTYIYETPGVLHRFLNGPEITEAVFISHGTMEYVDPCSDPAKVTSSVTPEVILAGYLARCEKAGFDRPAMLP